MIDYIIKSFFNKKENRKIKRIKRSLVDNEQTRLNKFYLINKKTICNFEEREKYYQRLFNV